MRRRLRRIVAVAGLGIGRVRGKLAGRASNRVLLSVTGVAIAVLLMTTISGVALGLASQTAVQSEDVDYWIVPEGGSVDTIAVSTDGPRLGDTHRIAGELNPDDRIEHATPVLLQIVPVDSSDGRQFVLFAGVIAPRKGSTRIAGVPTTALSPGDPYYNAGGYNGTWTGEAVLNPAAAEVLNRSQGETVRITGAGANFSIVGVSDDSLTTGIGTAPVAVVHLSELQTITGTDAADSADQLLVSTTDTGVRSRLEDVYPAGTVVTRTGIAARQASTSSLPLAMGITAFVVAVVVGVLFTATMMGLEITNDRRALGTLAAVGYAPQSVTVLVVAETVSVAAVGGVVGVVLGGAGLVGINAVVAEVVGVRSLAVFDLALLSYGFGTALLIGVLAALYPIWLSRRVDPIAVIRR